MCTMYTSKIIKASALIADTKTLLGAWDLSLSTQENMQRARRDNIFGKASRSRVEDILKIFRQRYFADPEVGTALVLLVQAQAADAWLVPLLYFFSAQADITLRDIVLQIVYPRRAAGFTDLHVNRVVQALQGWVAEGRTTRPWGEKTILRVAQNAMAALRDFGVLQGGVNKEIAPIYLQLEPFCLISHWLLKHTRSGYNVLHSDEWQLFFLSVDAVERFFIQAQGEHLLSYQSLGSVVRLDFPADSLEGYARVLAERAH